MIPDSAVPLTENIRVRGSNGYDNRVLDEFTARVYKRMGQEQVVGTFAVVLVNGVVKQLMNPREKIAPGWLNNVPAYCLEQVES